jgi:hypothetical protein
MTQRDLGATLNQIIGVLDRTRKNEASTVHEIIASSYNLIAKYNVQHRKQLQTLIDQLEFKNNEGVQCRGEIFYNNIRYLLMEEDTQYLLRCGLESDREREALRQQLNFITTNKQPTSVDAGRRSVSDSDEVERILSASWVHAPPTNRMLVPRYAED